MYLGKDIQLFAFLKHCVLHLTRSVAQSFDVFAYLLDFISLAVYSLDNRLAQVLDEEPRLGQEVEPDEIEGLHVCCYLEQLTAFR